jgi:hypothetical protein
MKQSVRAARSSPPLPLPQGERIEVRGFEIARFVSARTLTLPLSLWKGEATSLACKITSGHAHYHK